MSQKWQWIIELQPIDRQQGKQSYLGVSHFRQKSIAVNFIALHLFLVAYGKTQSVHLPFRLGIPRKYSLSCQDYDFSATVTAAVHRTCSADVRGHLRSSGETENCAYDLREHSFCSRVADLLLYTFPSIFHLCNIRCVRDWFFTLRFWSLPTAHVKSDYYLFCECGFEWEKWGDRCSVSSKNKYAAVFASFFYAIVSVLEFVAWLPTSPVGWSIIGLMQTVVSVPPLLLRSPTTSAVCVRACVWCDPTFQCSWTWSHSLIRWTADRDKLGTDWKLTTRYEI